MNKVNDPHPVMEMMEKTIEGLVEKGDYAALELLGDVIDDNTFTPEEVKRLKEHTKATVRAAKKDKLMEGLLRNLHAADKTSIKTVVRDVRKVAAPPEPEKDPFPGQQMSNYEKQLYIEEMIRKQNNYGKGSIASIKNPFGTF